MRQQWEKTVFIAGGSVVLRLAHRKADSDQKQAWVFETQIDEPGIGLSISIGNFLSENAF